MEGVKILIGIHVSGHLLSSKCTLLCKSHEDWFEQVLLKKTNKNFKHESWQNRMLHFLELLENTKQELVIEDLESFPVTSKLMGMFPESVKCTKLKVDLKFR